MQGRGRLVGYVVILAVGLVTAAPLAGIPSGDSFPFSDYPMFSFRRSTPDAQISHVLGVEDGDDEIVLPPSAVGTSEVIQAFETIRREVARGNAEVLCHEVAERIDSDRFKQVVVVTDRFDAVAYFEGDRTPQGRTVHAECETPR